MGHIADQSGLRDLEQNRHVPLSKKQTTYSTVLELCSRRIQPGVTDIYVVEHLYCVLAKCQRMLNLPYTPIRMLLNVMLSQETSSPVAELTWGTTPTAKNVINHGAIF